jgi:hypothetical protein
MSTNRAWSKVVKEQKDALNKTESILTEFGEKVLIPAITRQFLASGLKPHRGRGGGHLQEALTKRGAAGNIFLVSGKEITVGMTEALWRTKGRAIAGRGISRARPGHWLPIFDASGKIVAYAKKVKATNPKRGIIGDLELTPQDQEKANAILAERLMSGWKVFATK